MCNRRNVWRYRSPNELERRARLPADPRLSTSCDTTRRQSDLEETRSSLCCDTRSPYRSSRDSCTIPGPCLLRNCKESLFDPVDYLDAFESARRKSRSVGGAKIKRASLSPIIDYNSSFRGNEYIRNGKINTLV